MTSPDNDEALAGAATTLCLPSPLTHNSASENFSQSSVEMKYYYCDTLGNSGFLWFFR